MRVLPESYTGIVSAESKVLLKATLTSRFTLCGSEIQLWINLRIQLKWLMVGGTMLFQAEYGAMASIAPARASRCAVLDLVELILIL
jgi:hypothetical protein